MSGAATSLMGHKLTYPVAYSTFFATLAPASIAVILRRS
jgi:hypothetical protein